MFLCLQAVPEGIRGAGKAHGKATVAVWPPAVVRMGNVWHAEKQLTQTTAVVRMV